jgi:2-hydroxy-3-oxopropionate reductase
MKQVHSHKDVSVAVLGIGLMGERMAVRLLAAGYSLTAWNRSPEKAQALVPHGARVALTAAEAVRDAQFVILMLENGRVVGDVLFEQGVAGALQPGAVVIDMSSIGPQEARDHAQRLAELGVQHLDAPVSGGTLGAERGSLAIMCGGEQQAFDQAVELFSALGRPVRVGPHGAGQLAKLANQVIVGTTIGAVAEALLLARRGGADPASVIQALAGGFADSPILRLHGQRMVEGDYETRGRAETQLKDLNNAIIAADQNGSPTPYAHLTAGLFDELIRHDGDIDHSGLMREFERRTR